jgi:protein-disulfide isomerase
MNRFYKILGAVAAIGLGAIAFVSISQQAAAGVSRPVDIGGIEGRALTDAAEGMRSGSPDAPITIMEFGDFQCPSCAEFAALYKPAIMRELVDTGRASFVFHDYPLVNIHGNAFVASRAARCAGDQSLYWQYHDQLFGAQSAWGTMANPAPVFMELAAAVGADTGAFGTCMSGDGHAVVVSANLAFAEALQINQTPSILVRLGSGVPVRVPAYDSESVIAAVELLEGGGE